MVVLASSVPVKTTSQKALSLFFTRRHLLGIVKRIPTGKLFSDEDNLYSITCMLESYLQSTIDVGS